MGVLIVVRRRGRDFTHFWVLDLPQPDKTAFLADYDWWSPLLLSSISPVRISFFLHPPLNLFILFTTILSFVLTLSDSQSLVPRLHFLHLRHCYPSS